MLYASDASNVPYPYAISSRHAARRLREYSYPLIAPVATFLAYFLTAKLGAMIYGAAHDSPALIWPPVGIAFAATLLGGYRMLVPIGLAAAAFSVSNGSPLPNLLLSVIANTLQPAAGTYFLRKIGFSKTIGEARDVLGLILSAVVMTAILPTINVIGQSFAHTLSRSPVLMWERTWIGSILSVVVCTSLICAWLAGIRVARRRVQIVEIALVFSFLAGISFFLFWTPYSSFAGIPLAYAALVPLFWIALRSGPRAMTSALFIMLSLAVGGAFFQMQSLKNPIGTQLFQIEAFMIIISAIFLILMSVVEERRTAAAKLRENVMRLESALRKISEEDRQKSEFIAILGHELRNPLAPIASNLELMSLQARDSEAKKTIDDMQGNVRSMRRLLDSLLDIARVSQQRFRIQKELVILQEIVSQSIQMAKESVQGRHHALSVRMPENHAWIFADPARFQQILVNLLDNAAKYTPQNGLISLSCEVAGDTLSIQVSDNGVGIAPDAAETVFEPFRHLHTGTGSGLGIGLSIVKRLVEMHGGFISIKSEGLDKGSTFTVVFPHAVQRLPMNESDMPSQPSSSYDILVIDDNEQAARGLQKLLQFRGHAVDVAHSGESGMQAALQKQYRFVILDIGLPDMNGYEVARQLRARNLASILIALTGFGQEEDKRLASEAGFQTHLTKPVGLADLEAEFAKHA